MRLAFAVLACLLLAGCEDVDTGNSLDERLIARIDTDSLSADGVAEVRFTNPRTRRYFFRIYLTGNTIPDTIRTSYQRMTKYLDSVEGGLNGMRLEVEGVRTEYYNMVEFEEEEPHLQWSPSSDPIYGFWSGWPGEELPEGEYVFRFSSPGADSTLRLISAVTVERVVYDH